MLDVDSTLCGIEGVDWLAARRGADIAREISALTNRAMIGEIALETVYGARLELLHPTSDDIVELAGAYQAHLAPDARAVIRDLKAAGVRVVLVSGGIRGAIQPVADELGVELQAVDVMFGPLGDYVSFDERSPLARQSGKADVVRSLGLARPALAAGDGATDVFMARAVDRFVAYTGFVRRDAVVAQADGAVGTFAELREIVLGPG